MRVICESARELMRFTESVLRFSNVVICLSMICFSRGMRILSKTPLPPPEASFWQTKGAKVVVPRWMDGWG